MLSHSASVVIVVFMGFFARKGNYVFDGVRKKIIFIFRIQILVHECQPKGFSFPPFSVMITVFQISLTSTLWQKLHNFLLLLRNIEFVY